MGLIVTPIVKTTNRCDGLNKTGRPRQVRDSPNFDADGHDCRTGSSRADHSLKRGVSDRLCTWQFSLMTLRQEKTVKTCQPFQTLV